MVAFMLALSLALCADPQPARAADAVVGTPQLLRFCPTEAPERLQSTRREDVNQLGWDGKLERHVFETTTDRTRTCRRAADGALLVTLTTEGCRATVDGRAAPRPEGPATTELRMDSRGQALPTAGAPRMEPLTGPGELPFALPQRPVAAGDRWRAALPLPGGALPLAVTVTDLAGGVAVLEARGARETLEQDGNCRVRATFRARVRLDVARGTVLEAATSATSVCTWVRPAPGLPQQAATFSRTKTAFEPSVVRR